MKYAVALQCRIVDLAGLRHAIDKKVMLIDVDLNARVTAVEVEQCLGTVLEFYSVAVDLGIKCMPYMHHLGITLAIAAIEQEQHLLLELLAIPINTFSSLASCQLYTYVSMGTLTLSALGRSTSFATMLRRRSKVATCRRPSLPSFLIKSIRVGSSFEKLL
jgi:hypothetical protein